ncbi:MAG: type II toxin-antitoxin system RelE/ParE family toxin [Alphaproteobacteria bacterium]
MKLSNEAKQDLRGIYRYTVLRYGFDQADKYEDGLKSSVRTISNFMSIGRRYTTRKGKEFLRYNSGRHVVFYVVEDDYALIVRILHCSAEFDAYLGD